MLTELRVPGELDRRALRAFPVQCVAVWALLLLCMLRIPPKGQVLLVLLAVQGRLMKMSGIGRRALRAVPVK